MQSFRSRCARLARLAAAGVGVLLMALAARAGPATAVVAAAPQAPAFAALPSTAASGSSASAGSTAKDSWIYVIEEPGAYLDRAHGALQRRRRADAAANVRRAAAMIDSEATRARGSDRVRLRRDGGALIQVASDIESGALVDTARFDLVVSVARADLGIHHDMMASKAWIRHDEPAAGRALRAAGRYVCSAWMPLDPKMPAQVREALRQVEVLGDRLARRGQRATEAEWTQAHDALHLALQELGKRLEAQHRGDD